MIYATDKKICVGGGYISVCKAISERRLVRIKIKDHSHRVFAVELTCRQAKKLLGYIESELQNSEYRDRRE